MDYILKFSISFCDKFNINLKKVNPKENISDFSGSKNPYKFPDLYNEYISGDI